MKKILLVLGLLLSSLLLTACEINISSNNKTIDEIANEVNIGFAEGEDASNVASDLILVTSYEGATITWTSYNEEAITNDGKVTRTTEDVEVLLMAEIKYNGAKKVKQFNLIVIKDSSIDIIKPLLMLDAVYQKIEIMVGEDINLFQGFTAVDNVDGDLTDGIYIINLEIFNNSVAGTYVLEFQVMDSSDNKSIIITKTIIVKAELEVIEAYPVYTGVIDGEKSPGTDTKFPGAWYHRVSSSVDKWFGIEGTVTLPQVEIRRYNGSFNEMLPVDPNVKNLDNPSVYMGGIGLFQSDVGLSFSLTQMASGSISTGSYAFRPFWRYITTKDYDLGGYDLANGRRYATSSNSTGSQKNIAGNWHYSDTEYYYLPGDKIRMIVYSTRADFLQLQIEVLEVSKDPESIRIRKENGWKDPENFISPEFSSPGNGGTNPYAKFKRVNAIDQSGNENKPEIATTTSVMNAIWESTYLYRVINGVSYRVPMTQSRVSVTTNPSITAFTITSLDENGGQTVSIHPATNKQ